MCVCSCMCECVCVCGDVDDEREGMSVDDVVVCVNRCDNVVRVQHMLLMQ